MKRVLLLFFITVLLLSFLITIIISKKTVSENITLETKIGQMIIIGLSTDEKKVLDNIYNDIENNRVSGIIFYKYGEI
jgi:hypothetical protein